MKKEKIMSITNISGSQGTQGVSDFSSLGSSSNIQFIFAKLQLEQSQICRTNAESYITKIQADQEEQKKCADMIAQARELQNQAKTEDKCTEMPKEMQDYFKQNGLSWDETGNDTHHDKDEWEYNIKSLMNFQETLGTATQTDMIYLQDYMGQYNSFLQGANKAITETNQTMQSILTR